MDTNVFLRFLLRDNKAQSKIAEDLFKKAEKGKIYLWTTDVVILEIVWVLKSFYNSTNKEIQKSVSEILSLKNLKVKNADLLLQAASDFATKNIDFTDCYNFQLAQKENKKILSFDEDFRKLGKVANVKTVAS